MLDDLALLEGWRRGDEGAVRALFDAYYPRAVRLAVLSGLTLTQAQDCAQEAFVRAFERRRQLRDPKAFALWFHRLLTRHVLDTCEAAGKNRAVSLDEVGDLPEDWHRRGPTQPEEFAIAAEEGSQLWRRVQLLPARYRIPLVLRYYGDFSLREVAELMGMREGTTRVTIHRALAQLRAQSTTDPNGACPEGRVENPAN
jgi:RNA polymerase sigma-70 factor (ECF subfamily)